MTAQVFGFNFVTSHAAMKGASKGMLDYGRTKFENQSTAYSENDEFGLGHVFHRSCSRNG